MTKLNVSLKEKFNQLCAAQPDLLLAGSQATASSCILQASQELYMVSQLRMGHLMQALGTDWSCHSSSLTRGPTELTKTHTQKKPTTILKDSQGKVWQWSSQVSKYNSLWDKRVQLWAHVLLKRWHRLKLKLKSSSELSNDKKTSIE